MCARKQNFPDALPHKHFQNIQTYYINSHGWVLYPSATSNHFSFPWYVLDFEYVPFNLCVCVESQ